LEEESSSARVASGGWIAARILIGSWQSGHCNTSTANTRRISSEMPHRNPNLDAFVERLVRSIKE